MTSGQGGPKRSGSASVAARCLPRSSITLGHEQDHSLIERCWKCRGPGGGCTERFKGKMSGMGRKEKQKARLPFNGKAIEFYRPNDAQATIITMTSSLGKGRDASVIIRFFRVVEALVVDRSDWEWMEELMVNGDVEVKIFFTLIEDLFSYDWPEQEDDGQ